MEKEEENNVYIVQEGDTIPSVSLKFDVSVGWIKEINGIDDNFIFPGQKLIVKSQSQLESTCLVDNVKIFGHEEPGKLFIKNACLSFIPKSDRKQPKIIDLRGHIESAILPHPNTIASGWVENPLAPELPCLYIITWMNDIEKSSSIETMCFEGVFSEMNKISKLTTLQAEEIQRRPRQQTRFSEN